MVTLIDGGGIELIRRFSEGEAPKTQEVAVMHAAVPHRAIFPPYPCMAWP